MFFKTCIRVYKIRIFWLRGDMVSQRLFLKRIFMHLFFSGLRGATYLVIVYVILGQLLLVITDCLWSGIHDVNIFVIVMRSSHLDSCISLKILTKIYGWIIQESKVTMHLVKAYPDSNYATYQSFIRVCEHVFRTRPVTYWKDVDKVFNGIGALEKTPSTIWYCYEEKFGRFDMSWDMFKTLLLDDLFPPEICLRNVHKKYWEVKQWERQNVHGLIKYLEELEAQMISITKDNEMSIIFGALHP